MKKWLCLLLIFGLMMFNPTISLSKEVQFFNVNDEKITNQKISEEAKVYVNDTGKPAVIEIGNVEILFKGQVRNPKDKSAEANLYVGRLPITHTSKQGTGKYLSFHYFSLAVVKQAKKNNGEPYLDKFKSERVGSYSENFKEREEQILNSSIGNLKEAVYQQYWDW